MWCCKANKKTNSSRLETKVGELCPIPPSIQTVKGIIKQIQTYALSDSIVSIENGISRSIRSFMKTQDNQFVQL